MNLKATTLIAATVAASALIAPGTGSAGVSGGKVILGTQMGGRVEVPDPGDPNARGFVAIRINFDRQKLCFAMEWRRMVDPFAAHIHKAPRGRAGRIRFTLFDRLRSSPTGKCFRGVRFRFLQRLAGDPEAFYVNVHNDEYPDGAIRGQLKLVD